jgi:putative phosphoesterase
MNEPPFIGVLSDTHGHYDDALDGLLAGASHIIHAGDVGGLWILSRLRDIAPLTAVHGNIDVYDETLGLPWEADVEILGRRVLVCHIGKSLMGRHDPVSEGVDLVVSGHSHRAAVEWRGGTLFLNPGAAGRARFGLPRTAALVTVGEDGLEPRIVPLE